jgi:hypothetical protein
MVTKPIFLVDRLFYIMIFLSFFCLDTSQQFFFKYRYVAGGVGQQQQQQRVLPLNSGARFSLAPPTVRLPQPGAPAPPPGAGVIRTIRTVSGSAAGSGLFAAGMPPSKSSSVIVVQRAAGGAAAAGGRLSRPTGVALYRPARPAANGQRIVLDGGGGPGGGTVVRLAQSRPGSVSRQQPGGNVILLDLSHVADQTGGGGGSHGVGGSEQALVNFISGSGGGGAVDSAGNVTTLQRLGIVFLLF